MLAFGSSLWHQFLIAIPRFVLIGLGWLLGSWRRWPERITEAMNRRGFRAVLR